MKAKALIVFFAGISILYACTATDDKATMESVNEAVADSLINAAPTDSAAVPVELSPEAEEHH